MSEFTVFGVPQSTYVWTARMALDEKGVPYELRPIAPGLSADGVSHPFGKIPIVRHGDFTLHETIAITRYIDRTFDGPRLQPTESRALAIMDQWISAISDYAYQAMIRELVFPRLVFPAMGRPTDEGVIAAALPKIRTHLSRFEAALKPGPYLVGEAVTLADLFLAPILYWVEMTPEGRSLLAEFPTVGRWRTAMGKRASYANNVPPMPQKAA